MVKSTSKDAQDLFRSLHSAYSATPTNLKIIDLYVVFAVFTALIQILLDSLPPDSSEQRKQGIQGFGTRTSICRFCTLQLGPPPGDHQLPRIGFPLLSSRGCFHVMEFLRCHFGIRTCSFEIILYFCQKNQNFFGSPINTVSCTDGDPGLELVRLYPDQS
ncbi:unnamed protein product [Brassica rapa]|uniref:Dolichyl-diphosphooligosaccharide--protein glycosyltransferase subunit DAD1 n=2 Tax=Brassica TaxID=3705 RepID=A0A8D9CVK3_BRACM|nr:unnamed protein product [Brassica napus]CAG7864049.1 unnamed protein product [Brassica rapa]